MEKQDVRRLSPGHLSEALASGNIITFRRKYRHVFTTVPDWRLPKNYWLASRKKRTLSQSNKEGFQ